MENEASERISKLEDRLVTVETNVAVIRERYATNDALAALRTEMVERFGKVDTRFSKVEGDIATLRAEVNAGFAAVNARIDAETSKLRAEISQMGITILRWMVVLQLGTVGTTIGLVKLLH
jgi:hypothetical protein